MGLYVHSLERLPTNLDRDYYVYVLDYGWDEPLAEALHNNFRRMADLAARRNAVVIAGTEPRGFTDEIISVHVDSEQSSWTSVNGERGETILPALMITTIHPSKFKECHPGYRIDDSGPGSADDKMILIPLRAFCKNATEVVALIERLFADIGAGKPLADFAVAKEIRANRATGAYSDAIILKPTLWGMGIDLKEIVRTWRSKRA